METVINGNINSKKSNNNGWGEKVVKCICAFSRSWVNEVGRKKQAEPLNHNYKELNGRIEKDMTHLYKTTDLMIFKTNYKLSRTCNISVNSMKPNTDVALHWFQWSVSLCPHRLIKWWIWMLLHKLNLDEDGKGTLTPQGSLYKGLPWLLPCCGGHI